MNEQGILFKCICCGKIKHYGEWVVAPIPFPDIPTEPKVCPNCVFMGCEHKGCEPLRRLSNKFVGWDTSTAFAIFLSCATFLGVCYLFLKLIWKLIKYN